jgi:PhnB protein
LPQVDDADTTYQRALKAGAVSLEEPQDMSYGDRRGMIKDPCGNIWQIATHMTVLDRLVAVARIGSAFS